MMLRAILLTVFGIAFIITGMTGPQGLNVGDKASDFSLENVDGTEVSLDSYENVKGYIIVFTCNNCPYAKAYQGRIAELHNMYSKKGFPVIAINTSDPAAEIKQKATNENYSFAYLNDAKQEVSKSYGATKTPTAYVLNQDRSIAYIGSIDNNYKDANAADKKYVSDAVDALLANQEVKVSSTKAIGCAIKWKSI